MAKKTAAVETKVHNVTTVEQAKSEQPPVEIKYDGVVERVQFAPVEKLEEISKVGFICERLVSSKILAPLFRLSVEKNRGEGIDEYPQPLTPFVSAETLSDMLSGVLFLQPLVVRTIKEYQKNAPDPEKSSVTEEKKS